MENDNRIWRREQEKRWKRASAVDDVDGIFCVGRKGALVVMVGVLVGEENGIEACAGRRWEKRKTVADLCRSVGREWVLTVPGMKSGENMARRCRQRP